MLGRVVALCRWLALLPRALVLIVLALARALAQTFGQWRSGRLQLRVVVERFLAFPQFQQREFVGVEDALKQLELLQPGSLREASQRGLKACANSAPLPDAAVIETTRRSAMALRPLSGCGNA